MLGPIRLSLPPGYVLESESDLPFKDAEPGRTSMIRANEGRGARCQVAWTPPRGTSSGEGIGSASAVRIEPVDGAAPFEMLRVEGSDTDLSGRTAGSEVFVVDCDDLATAEHVASYMTLPI
jgi:hypothetical protein